MDQQDLFVGRALRDAALELVLDNTGAWKDRYALALPLLTGQRLTAEAIRVLLEPIIGPPHHNNAYGGVVNAAMKRGALVKTGARGQMEIPSSHAHGTDIYLVSA